MPNICAADAICFGRAVQRLVARRSRANAMISAVFTVFVAVPTFVLAADPDEARKEAIQKIEQVGGKVTEGGTDVFIRLDGAKINDDFLETLEAIPDATWINFTGTAITGKGLVHLNGMKRLNSIILGSTKLTDDGLANLKGFKKLDTLDLSGTKVTDKGMKHLKGLVKLEELSIDNTSITDAGLKELRGLKKLKRLYMPGTKVSDAGIAELQKALPKLEINPEK